MMKQRLLKTIALGLALLGGVNVWAEDWTLDAEIYGRTNLSETTYSWNSGWPKSPSSTNNTFNCKVASVGMFVLQKYTVSNLSAVKELKITLTGHKDHGSDALAIWSYGTTNPWPSSSNAAEVAAAVNTIVGVSLNTTEGTVNTPLVSGTSTKSTVDTDYRACVYTISGDQLNVLKNAANGNTFVLLFTNQTSEIKDTSKGERKFYSSGHSTTSYRPTLTVTYDKVGVTYGDGTKTNYSTFEAARSAVTSAAQDATITVMENQDITNRVEAISEKTINIVAGVDGVTLTSKISDKVTFLANADSRYGTINVGSADHNMILKQSSSTDKGLVEVSGGNANAIMTFNNVTFKDISSSHNGGIVRTANTPGYITLTDVTFDGCTASAENAGIVYCVANGRIKLSGNLTFTGCTGHNFKVNGRMEESSFNANQTYTIYNEGIALAASAVIKMSTANRSKYTIVNENRCLVPKGNSSDEELVVSEAYTLSVKEVNAATLIIPFATTIPDGVRAYKLSYTSGASSVVPTEVETALPANTPVLILASGSSSGTNYKFNASTRATSGTATTGTQTTVGALTGVYEVTTVPDTGYTLNYTSDHGVGFYKSNGTSKVRAYRAYMSAGSLAPAFFDIDFTGETTGIRIVSNEVNTRMNDCIYNLQGVRVENPQKGVYIKNGKKIVIK